jgi:hypothetical protein
MITITDLEKVIDEAGYWCEDTGDWLNGQFDNGYYFSICLDNDVSVSITILTPQLFEFKTISCNVDNIISILKAHNT